MTGDPTPRRSTTTASARPTDGPCAEMPVGVPDTAYRGLLPGQGLRVRIVDPTRDLPAPISLQIVAAPAAELLQSVIAGCSERIDWEAPLDEDLVAAMARAADDHLDPAHAALIQPVPWLVLTLLPTIATCPDPTDMAGWLTHLRELPAEELWAMAFSGGSDEWEDIDDDTIRRAAGGDDDALARIRAVNVDGPHHISYLDEVLTLSPDDYKHRLLGMIDTWHAHVWPLVARAALTAIARDAAIRRTRTRGRTVEDVVRSVTNGIDWRPDPTVRRVLLVPSLVLRPWVSEVGWGDAVVIAHPVADEVAPTTDTAPPPPLLNLLKAVSDERRLRLLRQLSTSDVDLTEAAAIMEVSKPTAHHHLAVLRTAGLVTVMSKGRNKRFALRMDPANEAARVLGAYLDGGVHQDTPAIA